MISYCLSIKVKMVKYPKTAISQPRGAGFDLTERTVEWTVDPLNLIQTMLAEG